MPSPNCSTKKRRRTGRFYRRCKTGHLEWVRETELAKNVLDLVKNRGIAFGGLVFHFQGCAKLLHELALFPGEFNRREHADVIIQIAFAAAARVGHALSLVAEDRAALRAFGNLELFFAVEPGYLNLGAKRGLDKAQRNRAVQIGAAPFEESMLLHFEYNVEVARRTAVGSRFAFARDSQARPRVHARREAQLDGAFALDTALAAAIRAALANDLTRALTGGAGARDGEKSLLIGKLSATTAGLTRSDAGAGFRPGAVADFTILLASKLDFRGNAGGSFLKGEGHVVAQVRAALHATASAAPSGKHIVESEK